LVRKIEEDRCLWDAEKSNSGGIVAKLQTKLDWMASESGLRTQKNTKLSTEAESLKSQLNESKRKIQELFKKLEVDRHLWYGEKKNLEDTLSELQTNLEMLACERGLFSQKNREPSTKVKSLKAQLNGSNART
jgi:chromosome segregation ATPase